MIFDLRHRSCGDSPTSVNTDAAQARPEGLSRRAFVGSGLALGLSACSGGTPNQGPAGAAPTLYSVTDPLAGYFSFNDRRRILRSSGNRVLANLRRDLLRRAPNCGRVAQIPIQDSRITLPTFYGDNAGWRQAVRPFWDIENAVSRLAAANLVAQDRSHANCLMYTLQQWARRDAMTEFTVETQNKQAWFQIEGTLFSMALALSAIRPDVAHRTAELAEIDAWLTRAAQNHFSIRGGRGGTCCNNHYYRRALYATIIGVMANNNRLFREGPRAIVSALRSATASGALPLEMKRGERAAHYQNYALMYLAMIAEIVQRQGYPIWQLQVNGRGLHDLVRFNSRILNTPNVVVPLNGGVAPNLDYRNDPQYFAWFEIYLSRFSDPVMSRLAARRRPLYNRTLGGHLTAYFYAG